MPRHHRGFSLIEMLIAVAIIGLIVTVTIPAFDNMRRRAALRAASGQLRSIFHETRIRAIARGIHCGMRFTQLGGEWQFAVYEDGDRDGVRNDDIKSGRDRMIEPYRLVLQESRIVKIGLLTESIKDPDGDPLPPSKSPVAFNKSAICSFSPYGESTPGTIYLTDRNGDLFAVRVYGASAKIRVLRYDRGTHKWIS